MCTYTNNSLTASLTKSPRCTINANGTNYTSAACTTNVTANVNPNNRFDLSLKKYIDTVVPANDADTVATAISKNPNTNFNYKIVVRNEGTGAVVGTTTVTDRIPSGLASTGMPYGSGWACHTGSVPVEFVCEQSNSILKNEAFPEITVPVWVPSNTASGTIITNTGTVYNSNETDVLPNTNPAVIQVVSSPQCSTSLSGALTAPITATTLNLCSVGTATGFGANTVGNTTNYAWSCNNIGSQSCTANYTVTPPTSQGTLSIKKYAGSMPAGDAQNESSAVNVTRDTEFNYLYRVIVSSGSVNGAIVKDVLPEYVEFVRFAVTPTGWSTGSTTTTHSGHTHSVVMHQTDNILASGSTYDFTIVARLRADAVGQYHQNIAYVCPKKILSGGSLIDNPSCDTTTIPPLPPDTGCSTLPNPPFMDPACIKTNDGFDLSIRKYINSDDAETAIDLSS